MGSKRDDWSAPPLPEERLKEIKRLRTDQEEIGALAMYRQIKMKERATAIGGYMIRIFE